MSTNMVPAFQTARLQLRQRSLADVNDYVAMDSDIEVRRYIGPDFRDDFDVATYRSRLEQRMSLDAGEGFGWWSLRRIGDDKFVAMAILIPVALEGPEIEIGWRLPQDAWGHGYATEAASRIVKYAREDVALREIIACIDPDNGRSIRVATKLGFTRSGRKQAYDTEFDCYTLRLAP